MRSDEIEEVLRDGRRLKAKVRLDFQMIVPTVRFYYVLSGWRCAWRQDKSRIVAASHLADPSEKFYEYDPETEALVIWQPEGKDRTVISQFSLPEPLRGASALRCVAYALGWR